MIIKGVTKKGYSYKIKVSEEGPFEKIDVINSFELTLYKGRLIKREAGNCSIHVYNQTRRKTLEEFIDMSEVPDRPISHADVIIDNEKDENKGFGSQLVETVVALLRNRNVVDMVFFSRDGKERLSKKYLSLGYKELKFKPGIEVPREFGPYVWLFYDYGA